jgi:hypothetical protein
MLNILFLSFNFRIFIFRYEGKKNTRLPKEYTERLRLRQKYKREFKSTTRALVLDNQFIGREELKQQMEKYIWFCLIDITFLFVIIEILNENAKSKIFTHNYQCKKENIEKCKKANNCFCYCFVLFFKLERKEK